MPRLGKSQVRSPAAIRVYPQPVQPINAFTVYTIRLNSEQIQAPPKRIGAIHMNTMTMGNYRPFQKLHPLTLLAQLSSRQASGCLQVSNESLNWSLYLEQGKLVYATNSLNPFERLDRHLRRLGTQVPSLVSAVRVQVRLLFESAEPLSSLPNDYRAICWLVDQQHLSVGQASLLVEEMAIEVIETFLNAQDGTHELVPLESDTDFPEFCQLDLRFLVEQCQTRQRQRQTPRSVAQPAQPVQSHPLVESPVIVEQNGSKSPEASVMSDHPADLSNAAPEYPRLKFESLTTPTRKTQYTIACIDDSPTVLQAIRSFLDDNSFSVLMIDNPVKALMQIVRSKPDLILLDVTMPNLDGYELCSLLRKHPSFRHTPVIMVTGNTGFIDRAKARLVGASGYLTKPFTQSDLVKMVFKHLT
jgi:twitching motility two-component system response regulator PilG